MNLLNLFFCLFLKVPDVFCIVRVEGNLQSWYKLSKDNKASKTTENDRFCNNPSKYIDVKVKRYN